MANTILTMSMITKEMLRVLENNLTFSKGVNRDYKNEFAKPGAKIGAVVNIRKPPRYVGRTGRVLAVEDYTDTTVPLAINTQFGVDLSFTSVDMALSLDEFSDRIVKPAAAVVANKLDRDGLTLYQEVNNAVGVPGTTPNTLLTYLQAGAKMDYEATPRDGQRSLCIDPNAQATIVDALKGLFHSSSQIEKQYEQGNMGMTAGFKWSMDQNIVAHTVGPQGGTPQVNGANQTGTNLVTDGWTAAAALRLRKGDVITVAGVFAVNPQNRQSTGQLRQFLVTADVSSDAAGNATIPISPAMTGPLTPQYQTISALVADNAGVTVLGAANTVTPANMAYHRDAFTLACVDLPLPDGADRASRVSDSQLGLSIRMIRDYDINQDVWPCRFDILYGWKTIYPELACRIQG